MIRRLFFELLYIIRKSRWDTGISPPELIEYLKSTSPGRALDLGCGTGTNAITMAQFGWEVTAVDFSSRAINAARRKVRSISANIELIQDDVAQLKKIQGSFDLILDIGCFHTLTLPSQERYRQNIEKFLRPGGTFLLYTHIERIGLDNSPLLSKEMICQFFQDVCECTDVELGTDTESKHRSAWFTMKRAA
jgi:cyclopropane fatty-acyl-phospholipid synthase-like methyltransferase